MTKSTLISTITDRLDKLATDKRYRDAFENFDAGVDIFCYVSGRVLGRAIRIIGSLIMSVFTIYCFGAIAPELREAMPSFYGIIDILTAKSAAFMEWCTAFILSLLS